eukprot:670_1
MNALPPLPRWADSALKRLSSTAAAPAGPPAPGEVTGAAMVEIPVTTYGREELDADDADGEEDDEEEEEEDSPRAPITEEQRRSSIGALLKKLATDRKSGRFS